jgi:ankyrin repeat protein
MFRILCLTSPLMIALAWNSVAFCGPIHGAATIGDLAKIEVLLKARPELVSEKDDDVYGRTPLDYAVSNDHKAVAEFLIAHGAEVNAQGGDISPLHWAALFDRTEMAKLLLAHGADVSYTDNNGETPLHDAVKHKENKTDIVEFLLAHGAAVNINAKSLEQETALDVVAVVGDTDAAELLVARHAEIGISLRIAAGSGNAALVEFLLAHGAEVNGNPHSNDGWTVLHAAGSSGETKTMALLLAHGAEVNAKTTEGASIVGATPLHEAAMGGYVSSVELLLAHNAQVNAKDRDGFTPLHRAAFAGGMSERANFSGVVEVLLAHGADVNAKDITNDTPLHSAAAGGYENVVDRVINLPIIIAIQALSENPLRPLILWAG